MLTIQQVPLEKIRGRRILVLIDPNIATAAPTLGSLIGKSARLITATHVGMPGGGNAKKLSLDFAKELSHALGVRVTKLDDAVVSDVTRSVLDIKPSEIVLLENLSLYAQDAANEIAFARQLASLCDLFVDDAFDVSHRALASNVGIARWTPISVAGPWLASRVKELEDFRGNTTRPFLAIVGGGHIETKLPLLYSLLPNVDRLIVGGALAFSFLKATGYETGKASVETEFLQFIHGFVEKAGAHMELVVPEDFIVRHGDNARCVSALGPMDQPLDIGVRSLERLSHLISSAYSILWVGSLGVYAQEHRSTSDWEVLQQLCATVPRRWQRVLLAGSELVSSLSQLADSIHFPQFSLFGDAALNVITGQRLAAIEALHVDALQTKDRLRKPVLIPVDGPGNAIEAARLVSRHVDVENAEIHLLYVHTKDSQPYELCRDPNHLSRIDVAARLVSQSIFEKLGRELARYGLTAHHQVVRQGDPAAQIIEYAKQIHAELIVMGAHSFYQISRFEPGRVCGKVLQNAKCPVLITRTTGERSAAKPVSGQMAEKAK